MLAGYLARSRVARHSISAAVNAIGRCTDVAPAVATLRNAAAARLRIIGALRTTPVSELPNGPAVVGDLRLAMQASAIADQYYAAWGQAVAGCRGFAPRNAALAAAQRYDAIASAAKRRFAGEWNPIAVRYGLARQNENTF